MNEHKDEVVSSVKESTVSADSAKIDENVTEKEKIEAIFGEKEEAEDMMVDVEGSDVVVDNHGVTRVKVEKSLEKETQINDQVMEDVGVVEEVSDVLTVKQAEVVKEVVQENVVTIVVSGSGCEGEKSGNRPVVEDSRKTNEALVEEREGDVAVSDNKEVTESVEEVVDEKKGKEAEILSSLKVSETITTDDNHGLPVVQLEDKGEVGVDSQSLLTDVVNAELSEENVHVTTTNDEQQAGVDQTKNEGLKSTTEVTTNDAQISDSRMDVESQSVQPEIAVKEEESERGLIEETVKQQTIEYVKEVVVDHVTNEKDKKDEVLDSVKVPESVPKVDEVVKVECLAGKEEKTQDSVSEGPIMSSNVVNSGTDEAKHENAENLDKKVEVDETIEEKIAITDFKKDNEPGIIEEMAVIDKEKKPEIGLTLTKETVEHQPVVSVQEVVDADQVFDKKPETENEVLDSKKIPESSTVGTEEVDVVVAEDILEDKDEAKQVVSSEKCEILPTEVDATSKTEKSEIGEVITTADIEPDSDVQVSTAGENHSPKVADGSNPNVVEFTDKVEPPIVGDTSSFQENKGLNASNNETLEREIRVPDSTTGGAHTSVEDYVQHDVEDDAGMDIDEVLGWKDEIPPMQNVDPTNLSNLDIDLEEQAKDELLDLEHNLEAKKWKETSVTLRQTSYFHSPENEGEFSVSDLVWGKVRSHPWWPGQIFDPSDASEKAMKYYKKDCSLVAYFGDRTFAWNESTVLKPFRSNFAQIANHTNLEAFDNAVHCALEEVSRRVELGLTCSCISRDIYENIKCQIVENSGIKQESSKRQGLDKSANVNSFEPDKLVDYVKLLAKFPYGEGDKMEITMAKSQLSAYGRFKGHRQLAEFQSCGDLLEIDANIEDGSRKRKANDLISDGSEKRVNLNTESIQTAKPSFRVGACIQKVASQLTGVDQVVGNSNTVVSDQSEMLSQLHLTAQDPMKGFNFLNNIIPFFNNHRLAVLNKARQDSIEARKRKISNENDPEEFEFDDVNDSYWTDRIIQNYPDEQMLQENQNGVEKHHHIVAYENNKQQLQQQQQQPVKQTRRSNKKRYFSSNHEIEAKEQTELIERRRLNLATEVLMKFTEGIYFPSEIHLNKMFKRFGPLLESETEVDRQSGRARVVFKKCCDAEVAHSSAGKFSIFGPIVVNYELNYTPLISYKPLPLQLGQDPTDAC